MKLWIIFVVLFGLFKGIRDPLKKKALEKSDVLSTLFMYTFIGFVLTAPTSHNAFGITQRAFLLIIMKSAVIFLGWILSTTSLKKLPVSLYGVVDMSRMLFATLMGVFFLGEELTVKGIISFILIAVGICMVNSKKNLEREGAKFIDVLVVLLSCILVAASGVMDKYIMTTEEIESSQLQFWFMLDLSVMYLGYILLKGQKPDIIGCLKNPYIYVISILLVAGDRLLFAANQDVDSKVTVMTLIKQCSCLVTIAAGKFIYGEKNILRKLICAGVILSGILLVTL